MTAIHRKSRRALPKIWLMTDERIKKKALIRAVRSLPRHAGVIFRHHSVKKAKRQALFERVRIEASRREIPVLLAGDPRLAKAWGADGWHGRRIGRPFPGALHTAPVHSVAEMRSAERAGADALLISPVHATRSHKKEKPLGRVRFGLLARQARRPVIALGGMTASHARALAPMGIYGWAAIDALSR